MKNNVGRWIDDSTIGTHCCRWSLTEGSTEMMPKNWKKAMRCTVCVTQTLARQPLLVADVLPSRCP
ncbi:hypothetical protein TSMEX_010335 [Taenia solium]|eukprot:TsM_000285400 transcript=TsM_000285400 gene=TsM_000285400